jgi:serine/threonine protein kinase
MLIQSHKQVVKDFMYQCFQKDPNLRITAQKLAKHPWMLATKRQIDSSQPKETTPNRLGSETNAKHNAESGSSNPLQKAPQVERRSPKFIITKRKASNKPPRVTSIISGPGSGINEPIATRPRQGQATVAGERTIPDLQSRPLTTVYDDAIQRVQAWNEALQGMPLSRVCHQECQTNALSLIAVPKASPKALRRVQQPHPQLGHRVVRPTQDDGMPVSSSGESLAAHLASVSRKTNGIWTRALGQSLKIDEAGSSSEHEGSVWDDDFAEILDVTKLAKGSEPFSSGSK